MMVTCALALSLSAAVEFEGEVGRVSRVPDPAAAPYSDCGYTFEVRVKGQNGGSPLPRDVVLIATAFTGRKLDPAPRFLPGERVRFTVTAYDDAPDPLRQRQTADDLAAFDSPQYFVDKAERIELFNPDWSADYNPPAETLPAPPAFPFFERTAEAEADRRKFMEEDLVYLRGLRDTLGGGDFAKWNAEVAPRRAAYAAKTVDKWVGNTYFKTGGWAFGGTFEDTASFRAAVLAMNAYLRERNIDLIVIRIPGRAEICADFFDPELKGSIVNPAYYQLQEYLLEHDVEYVDLTRAMVEHRLDHETPYWYFEPGEGHAAEGGCMVVADEITRRIARYHFPETLPADAATVTVDGMYKHAPGNPAFDPAKPIPVTAIHAGGRPLPIAEDGGSPLLLMGDSFFTHPSMRDGATIQHYTAWKSKVVPDLMCRMSAGSGLPRFLSCKGDEYLAPRRVVVWVTKPDTEFSKVIPFLPPVYYSKKELLRSIEGAELAKLDFSVPDGQKVTSFYSGDDGGVFKVVPLKFKDLSEHGSGPAGALTLDVSEYLGKYSHLLVDFHLAWNWTVGCEVSCGKWSDYSYLSLSDYSRRASYLVPLEAGSIKFDYRVVKVLRGLTLTIKRINIYGVEPK